MLVLVLQSFLSVRSVAVIPVYLAVSFNCFNCALTVTPIVLTTCSCNSICIPVCVCCADYMLASPLYSDCKPNSECSQQWLNLHICVFFGSDGGLSLSVHESLQWSSLTIGSTFTSLRSNQKYCTEAVCLYS